MVLLTTMLLSLHGEYYMYVAYTSLGSLSHILELEDYIVMQQGLVNT